ncbi:MAG TPA: response regulator transcription factor [Actinomycetota bacterium]|nr:response regulator transcription factor [Actinomycetota bacterium]
MSPQGPLSPEGPRGRPVRVLIVDDHRMFTEALRLLLEGAQGIHIAGAVPTAEEAFAFCRREPVDVVLMDIDLPGLDGVAATRRIREEHPDTQVVVITAFTQSDLVAGAVAAGASGYVPKTHAVEDLVSVIRLAVEGGVVVATGDLRPADLPRAQAAALTRQEPAPPGPGRRRPGPALTQRELEILQGLADGLSTEEVARTLAISPLTVRAHMKKIFAKLGVHSKVNAIVAAARQGLIRIAEPGPG